jgi:hypothetical protein
MTDAGLSPGPASAAVPASAGEAAPSGDTIQRDTTVAARYPEYAELIRTNIEAHRDRCAIMARRHRRWFRLTGVLTILFSVSLPALTSVTFSGRDAVISALAVGVAGLSGLRAFYQWDQSWQLYRAQVLAFEALATRWQLGMTRIVKAGDPDADEQAHTLTLDVLNDAHEAGRAELSDFFSVIAWPQKGT